METRGIRKEMRGPSVDPGLFSGTPLATNYPGGNQFRPPPQPSRQMRDEYYDDNPINDSDRFSVLSDDSSVSTVSVGSTIKTLNIKGKKGKNSGLELNIK
jgi:hypothetical protein